MASQELKVPDIGDFTDIPVIEILVKVGDTVALEQSIVTLESDKATMEVPADVAGVVKELRVKLGDKCSMGTVVAVIEVGAGAATVGSPPPGGEVATSLSPSAPGERVVASPPISEKQSPAVPVAAQVTTAVVPTPSPQPSPPGGGSQTAATLDISKAHASPSVRKFARELGVDLGRVKATGPKNRVMLEDVQGFVKGVMSAPSAAASSGNADGAALGLIPWPKVDFTKFGEVEAKPLSRIKKISGANLHRNWVMIPHVTNHDECDITELEALRVQLNKENEKSGVKVTMLAFVIKACVAGLKKFPDFNASLDGDNLVYKKYFNIGFAADTPNGLVVPVLKNADQKGIVQIAKEMTELSLKAREGKLGPADMQGGCFSISSLGGIGGTAFSPIINAPEVAILGLSRGEMKPKWNGSEFVPKLMLPLSLSYDHRVIDGASAARFNAFLGSLLADFRRIAL
jgi:pyruvate dehydrogenase E2 component (dihydrolipoamide acetyltransferase)